MRRDLVGGEHEISGSLCWDIIGYRRRQTGQRDSHLT